MVCPAGLLLSIGFVAASLKGCFAPGFGLCGSPFLVLFYKTGRFRPENTLEAAMDFHSYTAGMVLGPNTGQIPELWDALL